MLRLRALVPTLIFVALVVAIVSSLGAPLVPSIAEQTGVSLTDAQWSLTIALLVGAVATPTVGRLGDGPRRRTVTLTVLGTVTLGGVIAALPLAFGWLLVGRGLMGVGLGLTPLCIATARDVLEGERARSTIAMLSITTAAGIGLGYPLTSLIAQDLSFRSAFWFGAIISGLALVAALFATPASRSGSGAPFDLWGAVLLGLGIGALVLALSDLDRFSGRALILVLGFSLVTLLWWVRHENRVTHPLVNVRLAANRVVLTANGTALLAGMGLYLILSGTIRLLQTPVDTGYGLGSTVLVSGLALVPLSALSIASNRLLPVIGRRFGTSATLPAGFVVLVAAGTMFLFVRGSVWEVFAMMALIGLGMGLILGALPAILMRAVPLAETGSAMSFNQLMRVIGAAAGSALTASILQAHTASGSPYPSDSGYTTLAIVSMAVFAAAAVIGAVLPGTAGAQSQLSARDELLLEEESVANTFDLAPPIDSTTQVER